MYISTYTHAIWHLWRRAWPARCPKLRQTLGAGTPSWVRFLVYVIAGTILIVLQVHEAPTVPGSDLPAPPPPRELIFHFIFYF